MRFLRTTSLLLALLASTGVPPDALAEEGTRLLVQASPLAGSQYYALAEVWPEMRVGDILQLVREPENRHDPKAICVEWRGRKLGYVPRAENRPVAAVLDGGGRLMARVARLRESGDPWQRLEIEIFLLF